MPVSLIENTSSFSSQVVTRATRYYALGKFISFGAPSHIRLHVLHVLKRYCATSVPGVSNRWKSMIGKPIDQSISIDKIS